MTDVETTTPTPGTRAVVLGGGGVAGIAWELGVLATLEDAGVDLGTADLVVGTSAGSVVGTFLRAGAVRGAFEQQLSPLPTTYEEPVAVDAGAIEQGFTTAVQGATSEQDARARLGAAAQQVTAGQSDDDRVATFRQTLPSPEWPDRAYAVTVVDAVDGSFRVIRAEDGVPLERAVAASCSVPFVWSPVRIDGHPYVDGGARSATNADVAAGFERVLVIACSPEGPSPLGPWLDRAVADLRAAGSQVEVIVADEASRQAFGADSLALSSQRPSAEAGRTQAQREAERIGAFWA